MKLFHLNQDSSESWGDYMAKVHGLDSVLQGKLVTNLIVLFAIFTDDDEQLVEFGVTFIV